MKLIKNAVIITVTGDTYDNGAILFDDKIRKIGTAAALGKEKADEIIDLQGAYLYPGLIDAHCHVGMFEDSLGFEGDDGNEDTEPITPHLRAIDAINPFDRCFADAKKAGVTTVVTGPGSANPIGGQFAALKTDGICIDDMIIKAPAAMKFALGENPKSVFHTKDRMPITRMGTVALIRETLFKAKEYMTAIEEYNADPDENSKPEFDIKSDSLIPVLKKEIPVKIHAHRADDICTAIRLGKEFDLWITIEHGTDSACIADILLKENIPVLLGPILSDRSKPELKSLSLSTAEFLSSKGIPVAIISDHPETTVENLVLSAAVAVKNGLDKRQALRAVTIHAAQCCGIAESVGSLEVGKDADFCVFSDDIFSFHAKNIKTYINGKEVFSELL